eukprot:109482-Pyramimonas_sp.AAC.1
MSTARLKRSAIRAHTLRMLLGFSSLSPLKALYPVALSRSSAFRVWDMSEMYNPMYPTASRLKFKGALSAFSPGGGGGSGAGELDGEA